MDRRDRLGSNWCMLIGSLSAMRRRLLYCELAWYNSDVSDRVKLAEAKSQMRECGHAIFVRS